MEVGLRVALATLLVGLGIGGRVAAAEELPSAGIVAAPPEAVAAPASAPPPAPTPAAAPPPVAAPAPATRAPSPPPLDRAALERARDALYTERTLTGHTFIYPSQSDPAFITTAFGFSQGLAYVRMSGTPILGSPTTVDAALIGVNEQFDLSVRLHERVGLFGRVTGKALIGVDAPSALYLGAQGGYAVGAGLMAMLLRLERTGTQLGVRGTLERVGGAQLSPGALVDELLRTSAKGMSDLFSSQFLQLLLSQTGGWAGKGSLNAAQALGRHFSGQASFELALSSLSATRWDVTKSAPIDNELRSWTFGAGLALTADLSPHAPLAFQAEYRLRSTLSTQIDDASAPSPVPGHFIGGGMYYSGRRDLLLGANAGAMLDTSATLATTQILGELRMHYFF